MNGVLRSTFASRRPLLQLIYRNNRPLVISGRPRTKASNLPRRRRSKPPHIATKNELAADSTAKAVSELLTDIDNFLGLEFNLKNIEDYIQKRLDTTLSIASSDRNVVYEAVIQSLARNMWTKTAMTIYKRMVEEGIPPSDATVAMMMTIQLANPDIPHEAVLAGLQPILSNPNYTEGDFVALLKVTDDYSIKPALVLKIIESFLADRPADVTHPNIFSTLYHTALEVGNLKQLLRSIDQDTTNRLKPALEALRDTEKWDPEAFVKLGIRLTGVVAQPECTDEELAYILQTMSHADMDREAIAAVAQSFLVNRAPTYKPSSDALRGLLKAIVAAGKVDDGFELLGRVSVDDRPSYRGAFVAFLATLRDSRPQDSASVAKLFALMDEAAMALDTNMINILLSRDVRLGRTSSAVAMYMHMKSCPDLAPDDYTFGCLFTSYRRIRPRSVRKLTTRPPIPTESPSSTSSSPTSPPPSTAYIPLRQLFQDLMRATERPYNPIQPTTSLLNTALRAYMRHRDYVGALVVIKCFLRFSVEIDHRTYYSVFKLLIRRVWAEIGGRRRMNEIRWADRFLGVRHYQHVELKEEMVLELFGVLKKREFNICEPLYVPRLVREREKAKLTRLGILPEEEEEGKKKRQVEEEDEENVNDYAFPTMEMMESVERPLPLFFSYEAVPLTRVLARSAYAESDAVQADARRKVTEMMAVAEAEML